jgi:hypothetical protein
MGTPLRRLATWQRLLLLLVLISTAIATASALRQRSEAGVRRPPAASSRLGRVTVDAGTRFQTMTGWEATAQAGQDDSPAFDVYRDRLFDAAVDDLGIERLRLGIRSGTENSRDDWLAFRSGQIDQDRWREVRYSTVNDNDDPTNLNENGFFFSQVDAVMEKVVLPMKQRLEARGRRLHLNATYTAFTHQIRGGLAYHHDDPEEYAEFVEATYRHLQRQYGLVPDTWEIHLEPDNTLEWTPALVRAAMIAAGNRLQSMGITPRLVAPSTTNMSNAVRYADGIARAGVPRFWSELSYHRYVGVSLDALQALRARAEKWNLQTAMLEHIGADYEALHEDLAIGQVSAWQQYTLAFPASDNGGHYYSIDDEDLTRPRITLGSRTMFLRQYFRYIRRGAVRVRATSNHSDFSPLAFVNPDGTYVVVVKADRAGSFAIEGLRAGRYEVTSTTSRTADERLGSFSIGSGDLLQTAIADRGVLTVFGR